MPGKGKGVCRTQPASAPTHNTRYGKWGVSVCYSVCEHKCICKEHQQVYVLVQTLLYKFLFRLPSMDTQSHILVQTQIGPYTHLNAYLSTGTHIQKDIRVLRRHMCRCTFLGIFRCTYIVCTHICLSKHTHKESNLKVLIESHISCKHLHSPCPFFISLISFFKLIF